MRNLYTPGRTVLAGLVGLRTRQKTADLATTPKTLIVRVSNLPPLQARPCPRSAAANVRHGS